MFKKGFTILLLLVVSLGTARAQYDLDHFYYNGRQSLIDGKYAQAIESFNILAHLDSTVYEAYFFRGPLPSAFIAENIRASERSAATPEALSSAPG